MLPEDRRRYPRLKTGVRVLYQGLPATPIQQEYLSGVTGDLSLGGMFLSSENPFPVGTLLILEIRTPSMSPEEPPVCARALVRWRRRWGGQKGMGLSFVELEGVDRQRLQEWLESLLSDEPVPVPGLSLPRIPSTAFFRLFSSQHHSDFGQSIRNPD